MYNVDDLINSIKESPESYSIEKIVNLAGDDQWLRNCAVNTYEYISQAEKVTSYPLDIVLPMTCWCNAHCAFCRYCTNQKYFLPVAGLNDFEILLKNVKNFGLSGYGEPLLHPEFDLFVQTVFGMIDPRATIYLVTNGFHLKKHLNTLKRYCSSISVSLNAANAEVHNRVMRSGEDQFENVLEGIRDLVRYRDLYDNKFTVQMSFAVVRDNFHQIPEFIKLAQRLCVNKIYFNTLNLARPEDFKDHTALTEETYLLQHPGNHSEKENLLRQALTAINNAKIHLEASPDSWLSSSMYSDSEQYPDTVGHQFVYCSYLYQRLMITDSDRAIRTCCFLKSPPGFDPIFYESSEKFLEKWNNDGMLKMRRLFASKLLPSACRRCSTYEMNIFR